MLNFFKKNHVNNSIAWGAPFVLFSALSLLFELQFSLIATLGVLLFVTVTYRLYRSDQKGLPFLNYVTIVFIVTLLISLFTFPRQYAGFKYLILDHITLVLIILMSVNRRKIYKKAISVRNYSTVQMRKEIYSYSLFLKSVKYFLIAFLVVNYIYLLGFKYYHTPELHDIFLIYSRATGYILLWTYFTFRYFILARKLQAETWLPIVNDKAQVIGKVARSVSYQFKEKYLHPHVRILVFHRGMVYLRKVEDGLLSCYERYDTPVTQDLLFKQDFKDCIQGVQKQIGLPNMPARFLSRYKYEDEHIKRMIFLYTLQINDEVNLVGLSRNGGKFWTEKEIELNLGKGVFNQFFEEEFDLLKTTVFPVMKYMKKNV